MSSEIEIWLPVDRHLLGRVNWNVRPTPGLIAEPAPEPAEPVEAVEAVEAVEPAEPELPAWFTEGRVAPGRRRRRKAPIFLTALVLLVAFALGGAAYVADVLPSLREKGDEARNPGRPKGSTPAALVVPGPGGREFTCTVEGTEGDDTLEGTDGRDVICGLDGADRLEGGEGADILIAGAGDDILVGGPGPDDLYGESGADDFRARDGFRDQLDGGPGRDNADAGWRDTAKRLESTTDPILVAAGDIACDPSAQLFNGGAGTAQRCHQQYTAQLVEAIEPDAVLVLGDAQYEKGRYSDYVQSYDPTWGRFKKISHPAVGRAHDAFGRGGYRRYWGAKAGPPGSNLYSFDVGAWHIVALNSNCVLVGGCKAGSPQELWLRADLAAHTNTCTLAFWPEPLFSSSGRSSPSVQPLWQTLYDFGADVVLNADAHNYERFKPLTPNGVADRARGIRQFIVGTGGKSLVPFERRVQGSQVRNAKVFGVLELRLHDTGYEWEFEAENEEKEDRGSGACH